MNANFFELTGANDRRPHTYITLVESSLLIDSMNIQTQYNSPTKPVTTILYLLSDLSDLSCNLTRSTIFVIIERRVTASFEPMKSLKIWIDFNVDRIIIFLY